MHPDFSATKIEKSAQITRTNTVYIGPNVLKRNKQTVYSDTSANE